MIDGRAAPRAVVFDLDGTLVDSLADIREAANHALTQFGKAALTGTEIAGYVGDGARCLMARAARLPPESSELEPLLAAFVEYYSAHPADRTRLLPGAEEALAALARLPFALCTNKPRPVTEALLSRFGLADRFAVVIAGGDLPAQKPDPMPLVHIAQRLQLTPAELVMVGDGPQDIEAGKRAGTRTVGLLGGINGSERLLAAGPELVIESLRELPAAIEALARQATSA